MSSKRKPTPSMYEDENIVREMNRMIHLNTLNEKSDASSSATTSGKAKEKSTIKILAIIGGSSDREKEPVGKNYRETKEQNEAEESDDEEEETDDDEEDDSESHDESSEENEDESDDEEEEQDDGDDGGEDEEEDSDSDEENDENNNMANFKLTNSKVIYQFKITLLDTHPVVWRRIQVPGDFTFAEFDYAIQRAMGWNFCHNHAFRVLDPKYKNKIRELWINSEDEDNLLISKYFKLEECTIPKAASDAYSIGEYEYDMGDSWIHLVKLEKIFEAKKAIYKYPKCTGGKQACPPEDCGGTDGFRDLKKTLKGPKDQEYKEMVHWLLHDRSGAGPYDPTVFDFKKVKF